MSKKFKKKKKKKLLPAKLYLEINFKKKHIWQFGFLPVLVCHCVERKGA